MKDTKVDEYKDNKFVTKKCMNTAISFYSNTPDNMHCFQACIKMLAKHFWPEEEYSWSELDIITAVEKDLWTWPMAGVLWLQKKGTEVISIDLFDGKRFIREKEQYLLSYFGHEVGLEQIKHSNIDQELKYAKEFLKKIKIEKRIPKIENVIKLLKLGYLIICNLNWYALNQKEGYLGHFVVVTGFDDEGFVIQDPGLPPQENRKVSYEIFERAWAYPNENAKNILAFKR